MVTVEFSASLRRHVQCAAHPDVLWVQHHCGLYRSTDAGQHWTGIAAPAPSGFGFAVDGKMVVNRTDDGGASFQTFSAGLPQQHAYHLVYRHSLELAPDRQPWPCRPPRAACGSAPMPVNTGIASPKTCRPWPRWGG